MGARGVPSSWARGVGVSFPPSVQFRAPGQSSGEESLPAVWPGSLCLWLQLIAWFLWPQP